MRAPLNILIWLVMTCLVFGLMIIQIPLFLLKTLYIWLTDWMNWADAEYKLTKDIVEFLYIQKKEKKVKKTKKEKPVSYREKQL